MLKVFRVLNKAQIEEERKKEAESRTRGNDPNEAIEGMNKED